MSDVTTVPPVKHLLAATLIMDILLDGKTDRFGRPLSDHCVRVMEACRAQGLTEDQCIAAVLHDIPEEHDDFNDFSQDQVLIAIDVVFGLEVGKIVSFLTRVPGVPYQEYIEEMRHCPAAIPIKLADLADNLDPSRVDPATGEGIPLSLRRRYERARDYLLSVSVLDKAQDS